MEPTSKLGPSPSRPSPVTSIVEHPYFGRVVLTLIFFNSILVGAETYPTLNDRYGHLFHIADVVLLWAFTVEILLRIMAARPHHSYFLDGWNLFDVVVVASGHLLVGAHFVSVLRILRVLRVLRAVTVVPSLQRMVTALLRSIPELGNIGILLGLIFYIFGVLGTFFFSGASPEYFGSLHLTLLTLFQVVTLESWASGVMRPLMEAVPWAWIYFVAFVTMGTFVVMNLFIGVIVSNMQSANAQQGEAQLAPVQAAVSGQEAELARLTNEVSQLRALIENRLAPSSKP